MGLGLMDVNAVEPADLAASWRNQESEKPLTIILDQVEELYTRPQSDIQDELDRFLNALMAIFNNANRRPRGKLILSFRKEYLPEIKQRLTACELPYAELFLERLDQRGIIEAVVGIPRDNRLQQHYHLTISDNLAETIAQDLRADRGAAVAPTLQILLSKLWERAKEYNYDHPHFDHDLYTDLRAKGLLLGDFLDQQLNTLRQEHLTAVESGLILDLLAFHTTRLGTAEQRTVTELCKEYSHQQALVLTLAQQCCDLYLLADPVENRPTQERVTRLVHDTLAPLVRARFDESDLPGQRARRILESRAIDWADGQMGVPLDEADLALVEVGSVGMHAMNPDEARLVAASISMRNQRLEEQHKLNAEREATRIRELANAQALAAEQSARAQAETNRAQAESNRARISRWAAIVSVILLAFTLLGMYIAYDRQLAAEASEKIAQQERGKAEAQLLISRSGEVAAVANSRLIAGDSQLALLLGAAALKQVTYTPQARSAIQAALEQWRQVAVLPGHADMVTGISFSRNNRYLATASWDNSARVWDLQTSQLLFVVDTHHDDVSGAFFSLDNQYLITSSRDNTIQTRSIPDGRLVYTLTLDFPVRSLAIHPDEKWFAVRSGNQIWLYEIATGRVVEQSPYELEGVDIRVLTFTRDGKQILAGANDTHAHIWDIASGQHGSLQIDQGHQSAVTSIQQSIDRRFIASMSDDLLLLWEWDNGFQARRLKQAGDGTLFRGQVEFSPDSRYLAAGSASGVIRLWDLSNLDADPYQLIGHTAEVKGIYYSPDGRLLASASRDGTVLLWNLTTRESIALVTNQTGNESAPVFSRDGRLIGTGDSEGTVHLWKVNYGGNIGYYPLLTYPAETTVLSADQLAIVGEDGLLEFWRPRDGAVRTHKLSAARLTALTSHPTANLLAVGDAQGELFLFDSRADTLLHSWPAEQGRINALLMLPLSNTLVTAGSDATLQIWDWQTQQLSNTLAYHNRDVTSLVALPDTSGFLSAGMDGAVVAWSLPKAESRLILQHEEPLISLAISPSGQFIAAGTTLEHIVVKDLTTDKAFSILAGTIVHALTFVDDHTLAVGGENGEIQLWALKDRTVSRYNAHGNHWIRALIVSEDGRILYSVGDDGLGKAWLLQNDDIFALACLRAGRSLTPAEWDDYFTFNISTNFCPLASSPLTDTLMELPDPKFNDTDQKRSNLPFILSFDSLNGTHVAKGETVMLRWHAENATSVYLEYGDQSEGVPGIGSKTITIDQTTTFRLLVENWFGVRTMKITITPSS